jgi:hypothetical protein
MLFPSFLTATLYIAMNPTLLAHCNPHFVAVSKSQAKHNIAIKRQQPPTTTTGCFVAV